MTTNISLYMKMYFSLYKEMYNDNKYFIIHEDVFYYTRRCIMKIFVVIIQDDV